MAYSDMQIKAALRDSHIICYPLVPEHIRGSSIDVTLGEWFYLTNRTHLGTTFSPHDPESVAQYFVRYRAQYHVEWCRQMGIQPFGGIPLERRIIVLMPGERILAHTHEFIGILPPGTSEMRARSSTGRKGITVCKCAGWGDPGYINRWTMEIENTNRVPTPLVVGERVAQIVFHETGEVEGHYGAIGNYQTGLTLADVVRDWKPENMPPKAHLDEREIGDLYIDEVENYSGYVVQQLEG